MHLAVNGQMNAYRPFAEARSRVAFAVACFSAGTPLFLFGEEVAFENDFIYDNVLALREDFTVKKNGNGREMYEFYRDAIRLRREEPAFHGRNLEILGFNDANRILAFRRWYEQNEAIVVVSLSNSPFDRGYVFERLNIPNGSWQEVLNGDAEVYGGGNCVNREPVASFEGRMEFLVPKNAVLVLKKIS